MVRGINIARSMGLNQEKHTPVFSYFLMKSISEKMKKFRDEELSSMNQEAKEFKQIIDGEIDDLDYEVSMMRGKIE